MLIAFLCCSLFLSCWLLLRLHQVSARWADSSKRLLSPLLTTWLCLLLRELGIHLFCPAILWYDNLRATYLTANTLFHARIKHIEVDFHFMRNHVAEGKLLVHYLSTKDQIANIMKKTLMTLRFTFLRDKLRLCSREPPA